MSKVRVVYRPDKSVAIIHPAPKSKRKNESEAQWLERVFNKAIQGELKGLPCEDIDSSELPQGREDRDAWEWDGVEKKVKINPIKATQIRNEKRRRNLIDDEKNRILEAQAIANLEDRDEL